MAEVRIEPVRWFDLPQIMRMTLANMADVDQQLKLLLQQPLGRLSAALFGPFYLAAGGKGYKATRERRILGCAFLNPRQRSGYIYNLQVNEDARRQGVGRQLMAHLEAASLEQGYQWTALYVDRGNEIGRSLYEKLGYRCYFSSFWRRRQADGWSPALVNDVSVRSLRRKEAEGRHAHFSHEELLHGDLWAAGVVAADYATSLPHSGGYYQCLRRIDEVGFAWCGYLGDRPVINLFLRPGVWGDGPLLDGLLGAVCQAAGVPASFIDLYLGSSGHGAASQSLLAEMGFAHEMQARLLMLKRLLPSS